MCEGVSVRGGVCCVRALGRPPPSPLTSTHTVTHKHTQAHKVKVYTHAYIHIYTHTRAHFPCSVVQLPHAADQV